MSISRKWREEFIARVAAKGMRIDSARYLLSKAATLQRLAEVQCNGEYPAESPDMADSDRATCKDCEYTWYRSAITKDGRCPDCRAANAVRAYVEVELPGWRVRFQDDPRGCVVQVAPPDVKTDGYTQTDGWIGVPA
jgi:hypothetical protein